jgi:hypothetical protein
MTLRDLYLPTSRNVDEFLLEYSASYSSKQYYSVFLYLKAETHTHYV